MAVTTSGARARSWLFTLVVALLLSSLFAMLAHGKPLLSVITDKVEEKLDHVKDRGTVIMGKLSMSVVERILPDTKGLSPAATPQLFGVATPADEKSWPEAINTKSDDNAGDKNGDKSSDKASDKAIGAADPNAEDLLNNMPESWKSENTVRPIWPRELSHSHVVWPVPLDKDGETPMREVLVFPAIVFWNDTASVWQSVVRSYTIQRSTTGMDSPGRFGDFTEFFRRWSYLCARDYDRKKLNVFADGMTKVEPGVTNEQGLAEVRIEFQYPKDKLLPNKKVRVTDEETGAYGEAMLEFVPPSGSLVVSDVDDTILETLILSNREMLAHSLKNKHKAASGMPQLYERISAQLHDRDGHKPAWLYLSGSPWGLQPFLMDFLYAYYPPPSAFVLSDISLRSLRETAGTYDLKSYKQGQVREYMRRLPGKSLVLIGDATQYDPDSYAALYEEYPDNVLCILIREAQGSSAREKENAQNDMGRLRTAFKNVPQDRWRVFRHPSELVHIDFSSKKCH